MGAKTRLFRVFDNYVNGYSSEKNMNRVLLSAWQKPGDEAYTQIPAVMGKASTATTTTGVTGARCIPAPGSMKCPGTCMTTPMPVWQAATT